MTDIVPDWATQTPPASTQAPAWAVPQRAPGATGIGAIGQTIGDLFHSGPANHDPNALEQGIMDVNNSKAVGSLRANYQSAVTNGLFMQPVRQAMESLGVGRQQGETNANLHNRYNQAVMAARQDAQQQMTANTVGTGSPRTLHGLVTGAADPTLGDRAARLAQQVGNVGANIVANPQYFVLPGMGVGGNAATRVATAGVGNAGVGGVSDAAAQLMDMAEGAKKDFDVKQNIESTVTAGLFGSALHGAVEVAPFVSDLFKNRGMDTKPPQDPRTQSSQITPMTTDHVAMNAADHTQYQQLLHTGSVDDIKEFFKGRQGPQPSWSDVNTWVEHRDNPPVSTNGVSGPDPTQQPEFNYQDEYNSHAEQQWRDQNRTAVQDHITNTMSNWKNAPNVEVVHSPQEITDSTIRDQIVKEDPNHDALGFLGADGKVRVFSGRVTDPDTANAVLFHEGLGHFGLAQKFGDRLDQTIGSMLDRNVNQLSKDTDAWQKANPGAYGGDRVRAAEEVLAEASQNGQVKVGWQDAVTSAARQFGRKMGLKLSYSDGEVRNILAMSHDAVINGKPGAVENGFRGAEQGTTNKFLGAKRLNEDLAQKPGEGHVEWINRLKNSQRFWSDPEFRRNVVEAARTQGYAPGGTNKFMFTGKKATNFDPQHPSAYTAEDGAVRNEISDVGARMYESPGNTLGSSLYHPALFKEYPQLRDLPVTHESEDGFNGSYDTGDGGKININPKGDLNPLQTTLHETQHAIQDIEQHPSFVKANEGGGTTQMSDDESAVQPVEREAQATEQRMAMNDVERQASRPKFIMRSQAAEQNYRAEDLEGIYHALDEGYTPTERSWDEDKAAALAAGFSPSQLRKLKETNPGDLSTRLYRLQAAANMADGQIGELNQKLGTPEWTAADQAKYIKVLADRNYLVTRIKGERSELGRALNVSKAASSYNNSTMQAVADMLREEGSGLAYLTDDPTRFMKVATMIKDLMDKGNPQGAHAAMAAINKPYWEQYLTTFHYNAMLSGLSTHVKAPLDMMTGIAHDIIDHTLALPIGKMMNTIEGLTGQTVKQGITANEVAARLGGIVRSVFDHEVYVKTLEAAKTGEGSAVLPSGKSVQTNPANTYMGTRNPSLGPLSIPTNLIVAQDTFFRSHAISETLYGLGAREAEAQLKASGAPYTRDDVMTLGATIAREPTPTMLKTARAEAEKMLLLNPNRLTSWIDKVKSIGPGASIAERFGSFVANNLAPFIRVSANSLTTRIIQRSPLAVLTPSTRAALMEGGPNAHLAMARVTYGTVKLGLLWAAAGAAADKLTGEGPEDPNKKKELEASGWRPNAVHEDGRYNTGGTLAMSLNPFDLHNSTAQMVKSLREAYDKGSSKGQVGIGLKLALGSILHTFESETWVNSVAPAVDAATASGTSGGAKVNQFVGDEAKTWVPNVLNQAGRMTNPNQVDTRAPTDDIDPTNISGSIANNVQSAIPWLNEKLPTRYSVYGNPIPTGQSIEGVHTIIPGLQGNGVKETTDPTEIELNRLAKITKAAVITPVDRSVKLDGNDTPKKLTEAEFQNYQRVAGRAIVETTRSEMSTPTWQSMSDRDKVLEVRDIQTDMKKAAREALFNGGA